MMLTLAGELLAIGNVMLVSTRNESSHLSMRMPMAIDEFLRIVSIQPPPKGAPLQLEFQWVKSDDHRLQVGVSIRKATGSSSRMTTGCRWVCPIVRPFVLKRGVP
eukprot:1136838-Pelagomonas_calceolata.AAC.6